MEVTAAVNNSIHQQCVEIGFCIRVGRRETVDDRSDKNSNRKTSALEADVVRRFLEVRHWLHVHARFGCDARAGSVGARNALRPLSDASRESSVANFHTNSTMRTEEPACSAESP